MAVKKISSVSHFESNSITLYRVIATFSILMCHFVQLSKIPQIAYSAQFFNIGVQMFLIISGFLYGRKEINPNKGYFNWIKARLIKIMVPMQIVLIAVIICHLVKNHDIQLSNCILNFLNLQGFGWHIQGLEHLWYLTVIMLCYIFTPLLDKLKKHLNGKRFLWGILSVCLILQIALLFLKNLPFNNYFSLFFTYVIAYLLGTYWKNIVLNKKLFLFAVALIVAGLSVRLLGKIYIDGTYIYDDYIVGYSQSILSYGLFILNMFLTKLIFKEKMPKIISFFEKISYEIYLVHYMFILGPFSLLFTSNTVINCLIVFVGSILVSLLLRILEKPIFKLLLKK